MTTHTHNFTVLWGFIGGDTDKRLDWVTVSDPTFKAIEQAAKERAYKEDFAESMTFEEFDALPYDGFAIFEGHLSEAAQTFYS